MKIEASTSRDPYPRFHGKSVDAPLDTWFWSNEPQKTIGTSGGSFTHTQTATGQFVEYGNSAERGYEWDAKIYVDGTLAAQGLVSRYEHLRASIAAKVPAERAGASWVVAMLPAIVGVAAVGTVMASPRLSRGVGR